MCMNTLRDVRENMEKVLRTACVELSEVSLPYLEIQLTADGKYLERKKFQKVPQSKT